VHYVGADEFPVFYDIRNDIIIVKTQDVLLFMMTLTKVSVEKNALWIFAFIEMTIFSID
jgi:hypothetical protein